ncbi:SDR family NAD(P)-dependent oxidoreductase [Gilvibacter sediminis]|uniref:SDR family NAD(P)-dependent oxidoreductase n=1 Tax=Gilvibacter sediminis TaxID=379071 RepID=UPI0023500DED|nr:SDR family oxidoreductase [Gilvibacter sediminis]MDC7998489.1 SDR family oxidoreductase [Gilvibacter sediminis]
MKTFLVIGGTSGIGAALVKMLSEQGNKVIATYNTTTPESINNVEFHQLDVTDEQASLPELPEAIDGLAYCPGAINLLPFKRLKKTNIQADFDLQVGGAVRAIQHALEPLKNGNGSVVMFSTVAVQSGFNFHTQVSMSKGAIEGLTRALAAELAPTVRVNAIAPSITDTPLASRLLNSDEKKAANAKRHPLQKIGEPEDIANAASFLLNDSSSWITGQVLQVDGGISTLKV